MHDLDPATRARLERRLAAGNCWTVCDPDIAALLAAYDAAVAERDELRQEIRDKGVTGDGR